MPFALVIGDAANLPLRQFQIDQRQRRIGPRFRADQAFEARGFSAPFQGWRVPPGPGEDLRHQPGRHLGRVAQLVIDLAKIMMF
jgi:hypothetical protein